MTDLLQEFFQEIDRNLSQVSAEMDRWERAPGDPEALNAVFRIVHNVKATCHVLGFGRIEALAHASEDLLYAIREGTVSASPEAASSVREAIARIETLVDGVRAERAEPAGEDNDLLLAISCLAAPGSGEDPAVIGDLGALMAEEAEAAAESPQDGHVLPGLDEITEAGLFPETETLFAHLPDIDQGPTEVSGTPAMSAEEETLRDIAPLEAAPGLPAEPPSDEVAAFEIAVADLPDLPGYPELHAPTADQELDAIAAKILRPATEAAAPAPAVPLDQATDGAPAPAAASSPAPPVEPAPSEDPAPDAPSRDPAPDQVPAAAADPSPAPVLAAVEALAPAEGPSQVSIGALHPNPEQPRQRMDEEALRSLSDSIAAHGILQPILVRPHGELAGQYQIVAGERRWRAAALAGLGEVPVSLHELGDEVALELSLVENLQREDLSPIEEAEGYQQLIERFALTQEAVAERVGKSRSHVANALRLLGLPPAVKEMLQRGALTAGHARALLAFAEPEPVAREVVEKGLSVRATEELARQPVAPAAPSAETASARDPAVRHELKVLERELAEQLGARVKIRISGEAGEIRLRFETLADFESLIGRLRQVPQSSAA
ncbi:MAG: ParB/RepB/Spo0J family partition protein [Kiloniellales bacterium]|nr:ParB/RepB/Spo0J family partition protein [Kiloniellales bacterium]